MERGDVGSLSGRQVSWALRKEENPALEVGDWDNLPHPLVIELERTHGKDGIEAARRWLVLLGGNALLSEVIEWMNAGSFKGCWSSDADFCADFFGRAEGKGSLLDHFCTWDGAAAGFTRWPKLPPSAVRDLFDWEEWAERAVNRTGAAFRSLPKLGGGGVYVWDVLDDETGAFTE